MAEWYGNYGISTQGWMSVLGRPQPGVCVGCDQRTPALHKVFMDDGYRDDLAWNLCHDCAVTVATAKESQRQDAARNRARHAYNDAVGHG